QWFQDYLYYPLAMRAMRRGGWGSKYGAHLISMALIGLWHGANWTFLVFGLYWGVVIALYLHLSERIADGEPGSVLAKIGRLTAPISVALMFVVVCVGWMLFRAKSMTDFWTVLSGFFAPLGSIELRRLDVGNVLVLWSLVIGLWLAEL